MESSGNIELDMRMQKIMIEMQCNLIDSCARLKQRLADFNVNVQVIIAEESQKKSDS